MVKKFKAKPHNDTKRPSLRFVVNFREDGKRARRFFEKKIEADSFAQEKSIEHHNQGREAAEFPSSLRVMASECSDLLKPFGKTIRHATVHYLTFLRASEKSCSVSQLAAEMLVAKAADGASDRHLRDLKDRLKRFSVDFGDMNTAAVTSGEIDDWLRGLKLSPQSRNNVSA